MRFFVLVLAYLLALQPALAAAPMPALGHRAICHGGAPGHQPARSQPCDLCCRLACPMPALPVGNLVETAPLRLARTVGRRPTAAPATADAAPLEARARGPPAAI